jgi:hypothetical protein
MNDNNPKDVSSVLEIINEQEKTIERNKAILQEWMISRLAYKNLLIKHGRLPIERIASEIKNSKPMCDNNSIESADREGNSKVIIHNLEEAKNIEKRFSSNGQIGDVMSGNEVNDNSPAALEIIKEQKKIIERQKEVLREWMVSGFVRTDARNPLSGHREAMRNAKTISKLREEARKTDCPDRLSFLTDHIDAEVRRHVAENVNTPAEQLTKLSKNDESEIRIAIAHNINTPQNVLEYISRDSTEEVRKAVAKNPNTTQEILEYMSRDLIEGVRQAIATNSNTPLNILIFLSRDISSSVRYRVAFNSNSSDQLFDEIINELAADGDFEIRIGIASLKKAPKEAVLKLSKDASPAIRRKVAERNNTPKYILLELAKDDVLYVKRAAEAHPKLRKKV